MVHLIARLTVLTEPLKKMHIDVIHEADDDISIFLYFTFTLWKRRL